MSDPTVSRIILEQLGGQHFIAMTGANHMVYDNNSLMMKLPRNHSKANYLKITLEPTDTYTMTFKRVTNGRLNSKTYEWIEGKNEILKEYEDVYCDMLQEIFTQYTWMYTHL